MSELINKHDNRATIRWKLLTGASALALTAYIAPAGVAKAEDASQPVLWLTVDGQFAQQKNDEELFVPSFMLVSPFDGAAHASLEKAPAKIWNEGAALSFQPQGSDWVLSADIQIGKISRSESHLQQISQVPVKYFYDAYQRPSSYGSESHTILDFRAGKDLGLGSFGSGGKSTFSAGVRIAQFDSRTHVEVKSQPSAESKYFGGSNTPPYYRYYASFDDKRSFKGIGPSLSWDASAMIAGNSADGGISLDWGVNGALLFGRQKMSEHHQTTKRYLIASHSNYRHPLGDHNIYQNSPAPISRSKSVTVPNLGGFAGVSFRYASAKVSLGYRADYFFGAIDGGIDTAKKEDRGFFGPFASISVGVGN